MEPSTYYGKGAKITVASAPGLQNYVRWCLIFSVQLQFFSTHNNMYQFTCIQPIAPDNSDVHRSLQNCASSVRKNASCHPRIWRLLLSLWKICGPLHYRIHKTPPLGPIPSQLKPSPALFLYDTFQHDPPIYVHYVFRMVSCLKVSDCKILHRRITSPRRVTCLVIINILDFITSQWYLVNSTKYEDGGVPTILSNVRPFLQSLHGNSGALPRSDHDFLSNPFHFIIRQSCQRFPKRCDPRTVSRGSVDTVLWWLLWSLLIS